MGGGAFSFVHSRLRIGLILLWILASIAWQKQFLWLDDLRVGYLRLGWRFFDGLHIIIASGLPRFSDTCRKRALSTLGGGFTALYIRKIGESYEGYNTGGFNEENYFLVPRLFIFCSAQIIISSHETIQRFPSFHNTHKSCPAIHSSASFA